MNSRRATAADLPERAIFQTLAQLEAAWSSGRLLHLDSGITFACSVVSQKAYLAGVPAA